MATKLIGCDVKILSIKVAICSVIRDGLKILGMRDWDIIIIIIIVIEKGQQCKAGREWYTPYQSEDPSPTIPTYRQKEEKGKEDYSRDRAA